MKILFFDDFKLGVLKGDSVVDVSQAVKDIPHTGPHNLISGLIERFADYRGALEKALAAGSGVALKSVRIRPPLPKPVNIDCMAVNYMEDGTRKEPAPINAFHKSPNSVIGDGDTIQQPCGHYDAASTSSCFSESGPPRTTSRSPGRMRVAGSGLNSIRWSTRWMATTMTPNR